ncbi:ferric reductase like transmembrane component [Cordyceps javanica]|uniref:Ferric reductase like transmembrane component n=1 Tax=Cordyceps javanica TaxID=43265 RepID=A0A545W5Q5_9HYPO|nr:ferric reductase like transmembrane component [Cordyceps javanica]TQW09248.1 ferric reductase like transmembrane component [Cordyceps javanica]
MVSFNLGPWLCIAAAVPAVLGDGVGVIGFGKTMYQPPCAFACRSVVDGSTLLCTPEHEPETGTGGGHHAPPKTPEACFASDAAFMQTLALCIDTYCPGSDAPRVGVIEEYWGSHLAAGSIADSSWVPALTYQEALRRARLDEKNSTLLAGNATAAAGGHAGHRRRRVIYARHGSHADEDDHDMEPVNTTLPVVKRGAPLNVTSFVRMSDWQKDYNGLKSFELNEVGHSKYTIIITVVPFLLAIVASLPRFVPALTRATSWAWINSMMIYPPAWGKKHRQATAHAVGGGFMPTRGQSLYIFAAMALNLIFLIAPYHTLQPQSTFATIREQELSTIGCRAGVMAMGNVVVLTVFAGRNSPLLALTGWNYDTYLLFHRMFGYLAIFHTVLHSILLLAYYNIFGGYQEESVKPYWIWGIVATLAAVLLWPASVLAVRKRFYEVFLSVHHLLVALFLIGYFYHIFYRYSFKWGYEIWCYVAGGIWASERLVRLVRMVSMGRRVADVSVVSGSEGEYLRVDIDGAQASGLVYLYFPTLSWRFWENHPFSVASSFAVRDSISDSSTDAESTQEKGLETAKLSPDVETTQVAQRRKTVFTPFSDHRISILVRVQSGMTARLAARVAAGDGKIRLPVVVEGPYHATSASELSQCTSIVCIAGGVGVSAVLPTLREHSCRRRLYWGVRNRSIVDECNKDILSLPAAVQVDTSVGRRLDVRSILREELLPHTGERGPTGVIVCGPPEMADDVRNEVSRLARSGSLTRGVVLLDEAFTW